MSLNENNPERKNVKESKVKKAGNTESDPKRREILISKALSYLLRHGAEKEKLNIDEQGYVTIKEILNHQRLKSLKTTKEDIKQVVKNNEKKRFHVRRDFNQNEELKDEDEICATQGHSLKKISNENLFPMSKEELSNLSIYHGTVKSKLAVIKKFGGLSKMNRNHIHLTCEEYSTISGIKKQSNCLVYINIEKCLNDGLKFYKSINNVILTEGDSQGIIKWDNIDKIIELSKTFDKENIKGNEIDLDSI